MKQVIVVNGGLNLPAGKLAAQVAHGAVTGYLLAHYYDRTAWENEGMPKIILKAADQDHLEQLELYARANKLQPVRLIRDAGRTVVAPGTITCLVLGPAKDAEIDQITGNLPLL